MSDVMRKSNRRTLAKSNNERSYGKGGPVSPLSNPEIPMKNPVTKNAEKNQKNRATYQAGFQRKGCGGILKKKGCGGMLYKKRTGGKLNETI